MINTENTETYVTNPPFNELYPYRHLPNIKYSDYVASELSDPFIEQEVRQATLEETRQLGINAIPILKIPLAFYGLPSDPHIPRDSSDTSKLNNYVQLLMEALQSAIMQLKVRNSDNLPEDLYHAVKTMPAALFRLPNEYQIPISMFAILHEHIYYVYNAFKAQPDVNLEALLFGYPEYICRLLLDPMLKGQLTINAITQGQLTCAKQDAIRATFNNPVWALKWLRRNFNHDTYQQLLKNVTTLHCQFAGKTSQGV